MSCRRMNLISNKKTLIISILVLGVIVFLYGKNLKSASAQEEIMICPLNKMVTVGSLMDQSFVSISNLLLEVDKVLTNSKRAYETAGKLVKTSKEDCKPANCQSSCEKLIRHFPCPGNNCATGYTCDFQIIKKGSQLGNSVYSCADINHFDPIDDEYYAEFKISPPPCNNPPCSTNLCYRLACEQLICDEGDCSGQACPFDLIKGYVESITANRVAIEEAHQKIKNFFEKKIAKFPKPDISTDNYTIFGDFCKHPILSQLCTDCPGFQPVLANADACKSEFHALIALQNKAMSNVKKCDIINPDNLFEGKQGEILFRCKDVQPSPIKQCWPDDLFCCTAEE